jgi:O-antigen/teichoic acid export membrane protein
MGKFKGFIKKVAYAISANLISLLVSVVTTLIVPKFFGDGVAQYGYFQIYLFYTGYIGFFHFGWCDGIYLRDGGKNYTDLDKSLYSGQFWLLSVLQLLIATLISIIGIICTNDINYKFIWFAIAINVLVFLPRTMLSYYLQTTNRIKEYASITATGRTIYGISIVLIVLFLSKDYRLFVYSDVFAKFIALLVSAWWCRDIVTSKPSKFITVICEAKNNISVGIKLLFANIASMLITGIVRWGIQTQWDVETYGKISFTLSVSNLLLTFISAVALVLYPTLKRSTNEHLKGMYSTLRDVLMIPLLGCLVIYYPMELILSSWLPQYAESMRYMAVLFPMCIFAAKMTMLIQTYMNIFRLEKKMLKVNSIGVFVAILTTCVSVFIMHNLTCAMISIVVNQMFRCVYAEFVLSKEMKVHIVKETILEITLSVIFIVTNWFIGGWVGVGLYVISYIIYLFWNHAAIRQLRSQVKNLRGN